MVDRFITSVMSWAKQRHLLRPGDRVLAGVSGGADSMAMFEVLLWAARQRAWHLDVHVAHFNHRLRGEESRLDAEFVEQQAGIRNLPFHGGSGDARLYAQTHRMNLEQACRHLRYDFLRERAAATGADRIVTGHTMSDQAETFLMRLLRGAGSEGLASIRPLLNGLIARPLLGVTREQVREFCARQPVPFREDRTNLDLRFLRNRIRMEILPPLRAINPQLVPALARTASLLAEDDEHLQREAIGQISEMFTEEEQSSRRQSFAPPNVQRVSLRASRLASIPAAIRRRMLREAVRRVKGNLTRITSAHVEALDRLATSSQSGRIAELPGGISAIREFGQLIVQQDPEPAAVLTKAISEGSEELFGGFRVSVSLSHAGESGAQPDDRTCAMLDAEQVPMPLAVRARKPGERYVPYGKRRPVALKEMMIKKRIPRASRASHPVFATAEDEFLWSPGLPAASKFRIVEGTKHVLILICEPVEGGHNR